MNNHNCITCKYFHISTVDLRPEWERIEYPKTEEELAHLDCKISDRKRKEFKAIPYNKPNNCPYYEYNNNKNYTTYLLNNIKKYCLEENLEDNMVWANDENGEYTEYDYDENKWIYPNEPEYENIDGKKKRICPRCHKPKIDMNGICDVDFCLQGLTQCNFITNACCGHGCDEEAYIALADGRRFILDKEWSRKQ